MNLKVTAVPVILEKNGRLVKTVVIDIGVWNMDATPFVQPAHSIDLTKVLSFHAIIHNDALDEILLMSYNNGTGIAQGSILLYPAYFEISRIAGGDFDSTDYNDAVMNRGYIIAQYFE